MTGHEALLVFPVQPEALSEHAMTAEEQELYTAMRVSNVAAPQVLAVAVPVQGAVYAYQRSLFIAIPNPSLQDVGRDGVEFVAVAVLNAMPPLPMAVGVAQLSLAGPVIGTLMTMEYSLRVSVAKKTRR